MDLNNLFQTNHGANEHEKVIGDPKSTCVGSASQSERSVESPDRAINQSEPSILGILKTPGKRKTSNNRVEFLDNLQEREIPGRHT